MIDGHATDRVGPPDLRDRAAFTKLADTHVVSQPLPHDEWVRVARIEDEGRVLGRERHPANGERERYNGEKSGLTGHTQYYPS